jgi:parallel beta-helix repeat protein
MVTIRCLHVIFAKLLLAVALSIGMGQASLIIVSSEEGYNGIQEAINSANVGDLIEVHSGTYSERIILNKTLSLKGVDAGTGRPILNAGGNGSAIILSANGTTLEGFIIVNSSQTGIKVFSSNNTIRNCSVNNNTEGIVLTRSRYNIIKNNTIKNNTKNGVFLSQSTQNRIADNQVISNGFGIYLLFSSENLITNNNVSDNRNNGIGISRSRNNIITRNVASDNLKLGMNLQESKNNTLKNNLMHDNRYNFGSEDVNDIDTSNLVNGRPIYYLVNARDDLIDSSFNAGTVYCINCVNVTITDQALMNNEFGIYLFNTSGSIIQSNNLSENVYGLYLSESEDNNVTIENARGNDYPIYIAQSSNNVLFINYTSIKDNKYEVYLDPYSKKNNRLIDTSGPSAHWTYYTNISLNPPGAMISIDGKNLTGIVPVKNYELNGGHHTLEVSIPGHKLHREEIEVTGRMDINCDFDNSLMDFKCNVRRSQAE